MNRLIYPMLRGVTALLIGALLVFWSQQAVLYLIMIIGGLFLIPGLMSLLAYYRKKGVGAASRHFGWSQMLGVGSVLFGLCLIVKPLFFETSLMYALGIILSYAGLSEIISLTAARQWARVPFGFYVTPVLVMMTGIFILFNPVESASVPFIILGIGCMVYGLSDLVNTLRFRKPKEETEGTGQQPKGEEKREVEVIEVVEIEDKKE